MHVGSGFAAPFWTETSNVLYRRSMTAQDSVRKQRRPINPVDVEGDMIGRRNRGELICRDAANL